MLVTVRAAAVHVVADWQEPGEHGTRHGDGGAWRSIPGGITAGGTTAAGIALIPFIATAPDAGPDAAPEAGPEAVHA